MEFKREIQKQNISLFHFFYLVDDPGCFGDLNQDPPVTSCSVQNGGSRKTSCPLSVRLEADWTACDLEYNSPEPRLLTSGIKDLTHLLHIFFYRK